MPLYEYECSHCHHRFELLQKFSDEPARTCLRCGKPVHRILSSPAIQFKGTGWYITDYARKGTTAIEAKEPKGDGDSGKDGDPGKKEQQPAASEAPASDKAAAPSAAPSAPDQ